MVSILGKLHSILGVLLHFSTVMKQISLSTPRCSPSFLLIKHCHVNTDRKWTWGAKGPCSWVGVSLLSTPVYLQSASQCSETQFSSSIIWDCKCLLHMWAQWEKKTCKHSSQTVHYYTTLKWVFYQGLATSNILRSQCIYFSLF